MTCGIYEIVNTVNGKRYVGSSVDIEKRWRHHLWRLGRGDHHSQALQRAWDKHGESSFSFNIISSCAEENIHDNEQREIDDKSEYNVSPIAGSNRGHRWTNEQKKAHRISKIEFYKNPEARKRQSEATRKSNSRLEVRQKISESVKRAKSSPEVRRDMSEARRKQWIDPKYRQMKSEQSRLLINRPEHKAAIVASNTRPRSNDIYTFIHDVHGVRECTQWKLKQEFKDLKRSNLSSVCSGHKKSHLGWRIEKAPEGA